MFSKVLYMLSVHYTHEIKNYGVYVFIAFLNLQATTLKKLLLFKCEHFSYIAQQFYF